MLPVADSPLESPVDFPSAVQLGAHWIYCSAFEFKFAKALAIANPHSITRVLTCLLLTALFEPYGDQVQSAQHAVRLADLWDAVS